VIRRDLRLSISNPSREQPCHGPSRLDTRLVNAGCGEEASFDDGAKLA
jgi:hypothetical protein